MLCVCVCVNVLCVCVCVNVLCVCVCVSNEIINYSHRETYY